MNSLALNQPALASPEAISAAADSFWQIADALHLSLRAISEQLGVTTVEAYALITEEYGLRTRLGILRGDAANRVVAGIGISQQDFLALLSSAATFIRHSRSVDQIASVVNTVSVLCVSIFPGKRSTVNFLLDQLKAELSS
jgi:hypothetical protein